MSSEKQKRESAPPTIPSHKRAEKAQYFLAEVKMSNGLKIAITSYFHIILANRFLLVQAAHNFNGAAEKELSLIVGDYVVVRQVSVAITISAMKLL
jgi:hypothetical protein